MSLVMLGAAAVLALAASYTTPATAQDWHQMGRSHISIGPGFADQTHQVWAMGAHRIAARTGCPQGGYFADRASLTIDVTGHLDRLRLYVTSATDTVLLFVDYGNNWFCNDDWDNLNPALGLSNLAAGRYQVYVGTFEGNSRGTVHVEASLRLAP